MRSSFGGSNKRQREPAFYSFTSPVYLPGPSACIYEECACVSYIRSCKDACVGMNTHYVRTLFKGDLDVPYRHAGLPTLPSALVQYLCTDVKVLEALDFDLLDSWQK